MKPPRIPPETRRGAVSAVSDALSDRVEGHPSADELAELAVDAVVDHLWRKVLGDARDRVATVLHAARGYLESDNTPAENIAAKRRGLARALDEIDHPAAWPPGATGPTRKD